MRGTRAKKIRKTIDLLIKNNIIAENQRKNAERYFKRAWKQHKWQQIDEAMSLDGI